MHGGFRIATSGDRRASRWPRGNDTLGMLRPAVRHAAGLRRIVKERRRPLLGRPPKA